MHILKENWVLLVAALGAWFSRIENETLQKIFSLLSIFALVLGLLDWGFRKIRGKERKQKTEQEPGGNILEKIEGTQKPFKTVNMLENPTEPGEKVGNFVDKISKELKGETNMKKFIKWVWYNKEQLFSIMYSVAIIALTQMAIWTDLAARLLPALSPVAIIIVKVVAGILSLAFTALTVRNVCVPYGLSSLDTIDKELAKRAEAAASKLTPEQKKKLKSYISTLQNTLSQAKGNLTAAEKALAEVNALYDADNSLVTNYAQRKAELTEEVARFTDVIANVESKIAEYKAQLDGKNPTPKA